MATMLFCVKYWKEITIGIIATILIVSVRTCSDNIKEIDRQRHNIAASLDSLRVYKDKHGELYGEKLAWLARQDELQKYNKELADKVESLNKQLISGMYSQIIIHDTISMPKEIIYMDTTTKCEEYKVHFEDEVITGDLHIRRTYNELHAYLFDYNLSLPIEVYFTKDYSVILKSTKNVLFKDVQSFIDPIWLNKEKKTQWSLIAEARISNIGVSGGIGISYDVRRLIFTPTIGISQQNNCKLLPYIGVSVAYRLKSY